MSQPTFVLVRPQMGENIGAAARAMWNFGLDRMVRSGAPRWLAEPESRGHGLRCAGRLAGRGTAGRNHRGRHWRCQSFVYATTARDRDLTKEVFTPEAAMAGRRPKRIAAGQGVAVLFGPERAGLENDDIAKANAIISVPVNPDFASLNLAQCVLLTAYEWRRATTSTPPHGKSSAQAPNQPARSRLKSWPNTTKTA